MAEFSPRELDQLEDALEGLEDLEDLSALGIAPPLHDRLLDYQKVLRVSRDALPLEEVPGGLLDGVLAEARDAKAAEPERPGAWQRWRAALIPVFALAGTAAAVLWIVKPSEPMVGSADTPAQTAARRAPAPSPEPTSEAAASTTPAPALVEREASAVPAEQPAEPMAADDAKATAKPASAARKAEAKPAADQPAPDPAQQLDKEQVLDLIDSGDNARRAGDCDGAERLYRRAEKAAFNTQARARAWMGLGLCEERRGIEDSRYLSDAKAADPKLDAKIEQERASMRKSKPAPKKQSQSKSKMRVPDEAAQQDPFPAE
jgi:hypothetical protein